MVGIGVMETLVGTFMTPEFTIIAWGAPSFQELIVILVIVLIVFGAKRLPELARALGQSMNEFRKAKDEFEKELNKSAPAAGPANPSPEEQKVPVLQAASQTVPVSPQSTADVSSPSPEPLPNHSPENRSS